MREPPDFDVQSQRVRDVLVVAPAGEIDMVTSEQLSSAFGARLDSDRAVLLDLRQVSFLDTSGLRVIVEQLNAATSGGYRFAVVRGPRRVQRIFDIAGVLGDTTLVDDPADVIGPSQPDA